MHFRSRTVIAPGEYYHLFNRGALKSNIFRDKRDYIRFLFLIILFQARLDLSNISRQVTHFVKHSMFNINPEIINKTILDRMVDLNAFGLMPNHFHLIVKAVTDEGIAKYMQRVLNAYTKYYNTKYDQSGHLFQGKYQAVHIENNEQLLYLSAYIHKNAQELPAWSKWPERYPWSSFSDYFTVNRWGKLLTTDLILEQFKNQKEYSRWVKETTAKEPKYL